MAGGIGPPQDSRRRALVGTSQKESARTKPCKEPQRFVRQNQDGEPGAASRRRGVQLLWRPRLRSRLAEGVVSLYQETSPFPSPSMLGRSSSPSRVRSAAHTTRALDCCGRPAPRHLLRGKGALGSVDSGAGPLFEALETDVEQALPRRRVPSNEGRKGRKEPLTKPTPL
jgi:hypothetical protein